jgi:hypothetical protein
VFQEIERKRTLPHSFYEADITFIPKPDRYLQKQYRPIFLINIVAKILDKIMENQSNNTSERSSTMSKLASSQGCRGGSTYANL